MNIIPLIIGSLVTIMLTLNSMLSQKYGNLLALLIIHIIGFIVAVIIKIIKKEKFIKLHRYFFLGGVVGVTLIGLNNLVLLKLGPSLTVAITLISQMIFSTIIDYFGFFGFEKKKINREKIQSIFIIFIGILFLVIERG
ncbi:transporter family-2 protein [Hypnocyclicus thermotrophus]|uniref:Transporter family-2 protein n=1 Tax=Hypnocyclicus thermotrophus TaxID=1627895 RepID=A0AA46DZE9_9FUSO|nr:DMT family transporter [Hypnocyclicus thermotrophus]TDT71777.1 transporter family-2 protein [Hypnocyclicus thermotrophus]